MEKRITTSAEQLFIDLPQRVIVHKILIFHNVEINENEKDPYLLFGYFKNDRLRHIWFVFSSIHCSHSKGFSGYYNVLDNVIINYPKVCNVFLMNVTIPSNLAAVSSKMYSIRSIRCLSNVSASSNCLFDENFYSKSKFPKLKSFYLLTTVDPILFCQNWNECEFFDHLESLTLLFVSRNTVFDIGSFFQSKEKIFGKNLKRISLRRVRLREKTIISVPNLEKLDILHCQNLYFIPSENKLKKVFLSCENNDECKLIAKRSRHARKIDIRKKCEIFFSLFDEDDFPNLENLRIERDRDSIIFNIRKKWKFCSQLKDFSVLGLEGNSDFFQKNDWDRLERLKIHSYSDRFQMKDVKFPSLKNLNVTGVSGDEIFCFEGKRLERLWLHTQNQLIGFEWNKDIFRSLKVLTLHDEFDDSFFQEFEFPNLRKLVLRRNLSLKDRESWKEMKNLEEIEIHGQHEHISKWKKE